MSTCVGTMSTCKSEKYSDHLWIYIFICAQFITVTILLHLGVTFFCPMTFGNMAMLLISRFVEPEV